MRNSLSILLFFCCFFIGQTVFSQTRYTISGYVSDKSNGESAIGANVYIKELMKGTSTNQYGFFSLSVEAGQYTLVVSYIGFTDYVQKIELKSNQKLKIELSPSTIMTDVFEVTDEKTDQNTQSSQMGLMQMEIKQVKEMPALFGEVDILKTIQLLPGIQSSGEGNAGFYVRGGGPDQNLILLDGAPVYNASHLFGFFSVFNSDAIKNVELIKGGMPAQYGGRLASVLDIKMKEGNLKEYNVDGGIGIISSRLTIQGPIKKDTASFILSGRRTYAGELAQPFIKKTSRFKGSNYYFYDFNAKVNYILSDKDRIFVSGYFGRDVFTFKNNRDGFLMRSPWGNATGTARWNHLFSEKLFMNATAIFTDYNFEVNLEQQEFEFKLFSDIRDYGAKLDFNYFPNILHNIRFGTDYTYHTFIPSNASAKSGEVDFNMGEIIKQHAHEFAVYVSDDYDFTEKIRFHVGARYSLFQQVGPFKRYVKDEFGNTSDTVFYSRGQNVKTYPNIEPRFSVRYVTGKTSSLKASFTQNYQYIHLASLSAVSLPTDIWVPSSSVVQPQFGTQYALGYFRNFKENLYETSVEVYYKDMQNQVEYKEGALPESNLTDNVDNSFTFGKGWSYGGEVFLKKSTGKLNGWIGYTLSWTMREFNEINQGKAFFARYDRRHDISLVGIYEISKKLNFATTFVYGTGNAITLPVSRYTINGYLVNEYAERNSYRMASYHRLDLSLTLKGKETKKFKSNWNFSIYNVYSRYNPYFIYFSNEGNILDGTLELRAKQVSLFGIIPSITWNFNF